jgi:hypothetical protein
MEQNKNERKVRKGTMWKNHNQIRNRKSGRRRVKGIKSGRTAR